MASYTQLQADVNEVATRTVSTLAYTSLTAELNARLRLTLMEATDNITTADDVEAYALAADFLEARNVFLFSAGLVAQGIPRLPVQLTTEFDANVSLSLSGLPTEAHISKGSIRLNPIPDAEYTLRIRYIAKLADLSGGSDTNDVMDNHYNIYLYGALKHHTALTRDMEMTAHWGGMFEEAVKQAELADARKLYGTESLAVLPPQRGG